MLPVPRLPAIWLLTSQGLRAGLHDFREDRSMRKHLLVAAASLAFVAATLTAPVQAQNDASKGEASKSASAQRQKMKDCAAKWKDEKAQKHVSGRDAYRAYMKECLKG
jgi:psiF repeat